MACVVIPRYLNRDFFPPAFLDGGAHLGIVRMIISPYFTHNHLSNYVGWFQGWAGSTIGQVCLEACPSWSIHKHPNCGIYTATKAIQAAMCREIARFTSQKTHGRANSHYASRKTATRPASQGRGISERWR
jgi:hypothetical protein